MAQQAGLVPTTTTRRDSRVLRLAGSAVLSGSISLLVVISSWQTDTGLGAPLYWAWVLTGLQVVALWAAGRGRWWAWLLGAGVQPVWIVYAVLTGQIGFVPGCVVSAAVQLHNFFADRDADARRRGSRRTADRT
jgi:hypothetical protein